MLASRFVKSLVLMTSLLFVFGAAHAQAESEIPGWVTEGVMLEPTESVEFTAVSSAEMTLKVPKLSFNLSAASKNCSLTGSIVAAATTAPDLTENTFMTCTGVTVTGASKLCSVKTGTESAGTIKTNKLSGTLSWLEKTGSAASLRLKAASGTEVAKFVVSGAECAIAGEYPLTHEVLAKILPVEAEAKTPELTLPSTALLKYWNNAETRVEQSITQLAIGVSPATLSTTFDVELQGGRKVIVVPKLQTRLCSQSPAGKAVCPLIARYAGGKVFTGTTAPENAKLEFGAVTIKCTSQLQGESEAAEGIPLPVKRKAFAFEGCTIEEGAEVKACTEVTTAPAAAAGTKLRAQGNNRDGDWSLGTTQIEFKCPEVGMKKYNGCTYQRNATVTVKGGTVAVPGQIEANVPGMARVGNPAGLNCPEFITWKGNYILPAVNFFVTY